MAQLKDLIVNGASHFIGDILGGKAAFNIGTSDGVAQKNFIIYGNNRFTSIGGGGIQAYSGTVATPTNGILYINYEGGTVDIGNSKVTITNTETTCNQNLILKATNTDSPALVFNRTSSGYVDWRILCAAGKLSFQSATDGSTWTERAYFASQAGDLILNSVTANGLTAATLLVTNSDKKITSLASANNDYNNKYQTLMSNGTSTPTWTTTLNLTGNGIPVLSVSDLDDLTTPGTYRVNNNAAWGSVAHKPTALTSGARVITFAGYYLNSSTYWYGHQFIMGSQPGYLFHRAQNQNTGQSFDSSWYRIVQAADTTSTIGSTSQPVYLNSSGMITEISAVGTAYGGTGNTSYTASRMVYTNTATKLASSSIVTDGSYLTIPGNTTMQAKVFLSKGTAKGYDATLPTSGSAGQLFFTTTAGGSAYQTTTDKIYLLGIKSASDTGMYYNSNVYAQNNVLYGAAWNDYAEYRESYEMEPGRVVLELGNGRLVLSRERLAPGGAVISDTYGFIIGKGNPRCSTPIAVAGRVLVYTDADRRTFAAGDAVCSGENGTVSKMTREEIKEYPERIIGIVSEVPEYETWGANDIKVNGRIWIRLR